MLPAQFLAARSLALTRSQSRRGRPVTLTAQIVRTLGQFRLDVDLGIRSGETVAVLGPNGCGKTTMFRCLAGLLPIDEGRIELDSEVLDEPVTDTFLVPERRPVAVVFQDYLLFPNLTALENVAFGLRSRGVPKTVARTRAGEWLERVGLTDHAGHRPRALSGGQAQRVALARALATQPRLLLLDEPLAALDVGTRAGVRRDLRRHLATFDGVRLLVTHDPVDAYALADRVVILEAGQIVQIGTLPDVTAQPRSRYVADLVGVNLLAGTGGNGTITTPAGGRIVPADPVHGDVFAVIQPHAVALYLSPPAGSPRNVWEVTVTDVDRQAERVRVRVTGAVPLIAEITPAALDDLALQPGDRVWATVKATEITAYPA
jgi:molybdate transport system ATP-binding protein